MNGPIKGCGGADKLQCGLAGVARLLASMRALGFLQLRPGLARQAPGIPNVLGWNLWWHLLTGISAHGDIHPSVCMMELAAQQLPIFPHISVWAQLKVVLLSGMKRKQSLFKSLGLLRYVETLNSYRCEWKYRFQIWAVKTHFPRKCHWNGKIFIFKHAARTLWRLELLWKISLICLLWIHSNINLDWSCIQECLLQNIQFTEKDILKRMI